MKTKKNILNVLYTNDENTFITPLPEYKIESYLNTHTNTFGDKFNI